MMLIFEGEYVISTHDWDLACDLENPECEMARTRLYVLMTHTKTYEHNFIPLHIESPMIATKRQIWELVHKDEVRP